MIPRPIIRPQVQRCLSRVRHLPRTQACASIYTTADKPLLHIQSRSQTPIRKQIPQRVFKTLPLSDLLRTLTVLSVAGLPSPILSRIIHLIRRYSGLISSSSILSWPLRRTFYDTFCIGETPFNIAANISTLRSRGITGVVLSFAREAKLDDGGSSAESAVDDPSLKSWVSSNLKTIAQVGSGDYIAVKFTGAGAAAVKAMDEFTSNAAKSTDAATISPGMKALKNGLFEMCVAGQQKGVKIMVDAESSHHQSAIDYLTLEAMAAFNTPQSALVLNTYQMYLKSSLSTLKSHLQIASSKGYSAGVKLVRGAYLYSEPDRSIIHDTHAATNDAYNEAVNLLLTRKVDEQASKSYPAEVVLATHNTHSVDQALALYRAQRHLGGKQPVQKLVFAQLMGMADEISMKLASDIQENRIMEPATSNDHSEEKQVRKAETGVSVYKYTVWGTFEECLLYMLRRAEENQDAVSRSRETAGLMLREVGNRLAFWK